MNTLVNIGETIGQTLEQFKAWSQNSGHQKVLTLFYSYGGVGNPRQGGIIKYLAKPQPMVTPDVKELVRAAVRELHQSGGE